MHVLICSLIDYLLRLLLPILLYIDYYSGDIKGSAIDGNVAVNADSLAARSSAQDGERSVVNQQVSIALDARAGSGLVVFSGGGISVAAARCQERERRLNEWQYTKRRAIRL
jgi:hypothetical protein